MNVPDEFEVLHLIDETCDAFETALLRDRSPKIEEYLNTVTIDHQAALFEELAGVELEIAAGGVERSALLESLAARFPQFEAILNRLANDDLTLATPTKRVPNQLGRYEIREVVGRGAFGVVYRAHDPLLNRTVAVKVARGVGYGPELIERQLREAKAAASLEHPGIVKVHDIEGTAAGPALISEFIEGQTLAELLKSGEPLAYRAAARIVRSIADILGYVHEQGIVHRDLKPSNIMLTCTDGADKPDFDHVRVLDFGMARDQLETETLTLTGQLIGTPAYMSPEQAIGGGRNADARSDVYSMGVILFELLCGSTPFRGATQQIIAQVAGEQPPRMRSRNPQVPTGLAVICDRCLSLEPARRYQSARELRDDLDRWLCGDSVLARPRSRIRGFADACRRNRALTVSVSAIVVLLGLGFGLLRTYQVKLAGQLLSAFTGSDAARLGSTLGPVLESSDAQSLAYDRYQGISERGDESWNDEQFRLRLALFNHRSDELPDVDEVVRQLDAQMEFYLLCEALDAYPVNAAANCKKQVIQELKQHLIPPMAAAPLGDSFAEIEAAEIRNEPQWRRFALQTLTLARLGEWDLVFRHLEESADPRLSTYFIGLAPEFGVSYGDLFEALERSSSPLVRYTLLLSFGTLPAGNQAMEDRLARWVEEEYEYNPSAAVHSACWWLLCERGRHDVIARLDRKLASRGDQPDFDWYVNSLGQTFIKVRLGGPQNGGVPQLNQSPRVERVVAIAAHELARHDYDWILQTRGTPAPAGQAEAYDSSPRGFPKQFITPAEALRYCELLTAYESISEADGTLAFGRLSGGAGFRPQWVDVALAKNEYRLPTAEEWQEAARGNASTTRFYGSRTTPYAHLFVNSQPALLVEGDDEQQPAPLASGIKMPNRAGFFDVLGNMSEFTIGDSTQMHPVQDGMETRRLTSDDPESVRAAGGSFFSPAALSHTSYSGRYAFHGSTSDAGVRVARMMHHSSDALKVNVKSTANSGVALE